MSAGFWNSHVVMDPTDLETMFSNDDGLGASSLDFVEALREDRATDFSKVREVLHQIHPGMPGPWYDLFYYRY